MKQQEPMDPTGQHTAFHFHADSGLGTTILTSLALTSPMVLTVADAAMRIVINVLVTLVAGLIIGKMNRRWAREEVAAIAAAEAKARASTITTAGAAGAAAAVAVVTKSERPPPLPPE